MELETIAENIKNKEEFEQFLEALYLNYCQKPEEWENRSLKDFFNAMYRYTKDLEGYYKNWNLKYDIEKPSWKMFSDILLGAKIYE